MTITAWVWGGAKKSLVAAAFRRLWLPALRTALFHSTPTVIAKAYHNAEDEHFRRMFDERDRNLEDDVAKGVYHQAVTEFVELSAFARGRGTKAEATASETIIAKLVANRTQFRFSDLLAIATCLTRWPPSESNRSRTYHRLLNAVDAAIDRKLPQLETAEIVKASLKFNRLGLSRVSKIGRRGIEVLMSRLQALTVEEVKFLLFAIVALREWPSSRGPDLEAKIRELLTDRNVDGRDLGLISVAYFKTKTKCRDLTIIDDVVNAACRLLAAGHRIDDVSLSAVAKFAGYMSRGAWLTGSGSVLRIIESSLPFSRDISLSASIHLLEAGAQHRVSCDEFLRVAQQRVCSEDSRLKEVERFLLAADQVGPGLTQKDFLDVMEKLCRIPAEECRKYLHSFQVCVRILAGHGVFEDSWVRMCLEPNAIRALLDSLDYPDSLRELWELDCLVALRFRSYRGPRLPSDLLDLAVKKYARKDPIVNVNYRESLMPGEKLLLETVNNTIKTSGQEASSWDSCIFYALPFLSVPCILIRKSPRGVFEPVHAADSLARPIANAQQWMPPWRSSEVTAAIWKDGVVLVPALARYRVKNCPDRFTGRLGLFVRLMKESGADVVMVTGEPLTRNAELGAVLERGSGSLTPN